MKSNKAVALNMIANVLSFVVSLVISFFITPYITKTVGIEAYGLVGLANSFTNYITVVTAAINSMASRFIIIELHKKETNKANTYFSSVLIANTVIAVVILLMSILLVFNIGVLNISPELIFDAQITFAIIALNFVVGLIGAFFGVVLYAKNLLWKGSFRVLEGNILRVFITISLFYFISGKVYYVVLATFLSAFYSIGFNVYYTKKYAPELKASKKYFSFSAIKELIAAGIWNSITKLSQILLDGLDLLLSNIFINGVMTGNVSIAKTIPSLYTSVVAILSDSFYPQFLEQYSKNKTDELLKSIKNSITVLSTISGICLSILIVYAKDFYALWIPHGDSNLLQTLTYLSVGTVMISGCVYSLFSVFSLTNKIKYNSIALLITGVLSTITTFLCLKFTNLGIYAIVGVSSIFGIIRNLTFTPMYAAKCLNVKWNTFYTTICKNLINILVLIVIFSLIKSILPATSWILLLINGFIDIVIGVVITYFVVLSQDQKNMIIQKFRNK